MVGSRREGAFLAKGVGILFCVHYLFCFDLHALCCSRGRLLSVPYVHIIHVISSLATHRGVSGGLESRRARALTLQRYP